MVTFIMCSKGLLHTFYIYFTYLTMTIDTSFLNVKRKVSVTLSALLLLFALSYFFQLIWILMQIAALQNQTHLYSI